jgi:alpha-galactosidase
MDIDPDRLAAVTGLAKRLANELDADIRFEETLDRETALRDTEFVVNTAYASGHARAIRFRQAMTRLGYHYSNVGLYGPIDLWAREDLQFRLDFARDMERICPEAWLLQSGNPVFEGCTLMTRETSVKVIGICHGYRDRLEVGAALGLDPDRVTWEASGLNHQIWLTSLRYDGVDAYPLLNEWVDSTAEEYWRTHLQRHPHDIVMSRGAINLYRLFGLMPIGDTARDPINWWLHRDFQSKLHWFGRPWGGPDTIAGRREFVRKLHERVKSIGAVVADPSASAVSLLPPMLHETHIGIIDALANGNGGTFQVNIPNRGTLPGIADDVVVEVAARIDASGVHPLPAIPLPRKIMLEQTLPRVLQMEQQLAALLSRDDSMLLWGALMHHQTRTYDQAVRAVGAYRGLEDPSAA